MSETTTEAVAVVKTEEEQATEMKKVEKEDQEQVKENEETNIKEDQTQQQQPLSNITNSNTLVVAGGMATEQQKATYLERSSLLINHSGGAPPYPLYCLSNYTFGTKDPIFERDKSVLDRFQVI